MATHRHTLSAPTFSIPATAPNSPATTRNSNTTSNRYVVPITPQRIQTKSNGLVQNQNQNYNQHPNQIQSAFQPRRRSVLQSPSTPLSGTSTSSPYTPLSQRSNSTLSFSSSNVTTPGSAYSIGIKRLNLGPASSMSPEVPLASRILKEGEGKEGKDQSLADIAENWRSRANENGIRVSSSECEGDADDEGSERTNSSRDTGHASKPKSRTDEPTQSENPLGPNYVSEDALLPPPFLSNHRRPRAQSHSQSLSYPSSFTSPTNLPFFFSPQSEPKLHSQSFSSHDPNQSLDFDFDQSYDQSLDQSFSFSPQALRTPARRPLMPAPQTLRPENLYTPPQKKSTQSALLNKGSLTDPVKPRRRPAPQLFDISEDFISAPVLDADTSFAPYPNTFGAQGQQGEIGLGLNDPFEFQPYAYPYGQKLGIIEETAQGQLFEDAYPDSESPYSLPAAISMPKFSPPPFSLTEQEPTKKVTIPNGCSVCGRPSTSGSQAVLIPCSHLLCSACLTSALNIVGEKDMECSVCKQGVENFKLVAAPPASAVSTGDQERNTMGDGESSGKKEDTLQSDFDFFENARASSSPPPTKTKKSASLIGNNGDNVVLRIDNVPWDITPPAIRTWLSNPPSLVNIHVLLDRRGKTLSHAFVEFDDEEAGRAALRGAQKNSVLGKGKRARGVTVTRSGQEELMRSLFPSWKGKFDGSRPSLSGLSNPHVVQTLETGLITESELTSLMHLIRSPDAHFLKVPSLPFWSLVSILAKFPSEIDSRVFWSGGLRDSLFGVAMGGVSVLLGRVNGDHGAAGKEEDMELIDKVFGAAIKCQAFTSQQISQLTSVVDTTPYSYGSPFVSESPPSSPISYMRTPEPFHQSQVQLRRPMNGNASGHRESFGALAKEFGLEAHMVQALAQRLAAY